MVTGRKSRSKPKRDRWIQQNRIIRVVPGQPDMLIPPVPTGQLFKDCSCCGNRLGGSTTDPMKMCAVCTRECSPLWFVQRTEGH